MVTASMDLKSMVEYNEFNSNCKTAPILAHDAECIYPLKLLLSWSVICLTALSGPIVSPLSFVSVGIQLPKIEHKGRDAEYYLKWSSMSKNGEKRSQKVRALRYVWNVKSCLGKARVKRKFINLKNPNNNNVLEIKIVLH